jgi:FtsP/CotA-like multicopper oxidase with cupredoxin domain
LLIDLYYILGYIESNLTNSLKSIKKSYHLILPVLSLFVMFLSLSITDEGANPYDIENPVFAQQDGQTKVKQDSNTLVSNVSMGVGNNVPTYTEATVPNRQITLVTEDAEIDIAPGKRVKVWTYNGTVPGPTIRLTEGENVTIKYINKSPIPHTIHFHGNHDDLNDGVVPQVMPNQTYLYNITGEPAGALMYHCHAPPTSLHIRMGMYGALIVDPSEKPLPPAKEFVMVMGEYSLEDQLGLDADYYIINGYADQYMHNPLQINHGDLMRLYVINLGTTIPVSFHLHSTTFYAYPSGLWDNPPFHVQTAPIAPGDASIIEAKWKYPGTYLFHSHGIQEERGNMGQIEVVGEGDAKGVASTESQSNNNISTSLSAIQSGNSSQPLTKSVSMFDWQFDLQKKLQKPQVINYSQGGESLKEQNANNDTKEIQQGGENLSLSLDKSLATNLGGENNTDTNMTLSGDNNNNGKKNDLVSIVPGSASPGNKIFYDPPNPKIKQGTELTWINNDGSIPHTVTSGLPESGPSGEFDSGIMMGGGSFKYNFEKEGEYPYYCTIHPWMTAMVTVIK